MDKELETYNRELDRTTVRLALKLLAVNKIIKPAESYEEASKWVDKLFNHIIKIYDPKVQDKLNAMYYFGEDVELVDGFLEKEEAYAIASGEKEDGKVKVTIKVDSSLIGKDGKKGFILKQTLLHEIAIHSGQDLELESRTGSADFLEHSEEFFKRYSRISEMGAAAADKILIDFVPVKLVERELIMEGAPRATKETTFRTHVETHIRSIKSHIAIPGYASSAKDITRHDRSLFKTLTDNYKEPPVSKDERSNAKVYDTVMERMTSSVAEALADFNRTVQQPRTRDKALEVINRFFEKVIKAYDTDIQDELRKMYYEDEGLDEKKDMLWNDYSGVSSAGFDHSYSMRKPFVSIDEDVISGKSVIYKSQMALEVAVELGMDLQMQAMTLSTAFSKNKLSSPRYERVAKMTKRAAEKILSDWIPNMFTEKDIKKLSEDNQDHLKERSKRLAKSSMEDAVALKIFPIDKDSKRRVKEEDIALFSRLTERYRSPAKRGMSR